MFSIVSAGICTTEKLALVMLLVTFVLLIFESNSQFSGLGFCLFWFGLTKLFDILGNNVCKVATVHPLSVYVKRVQLEDR